MKLRVLSWFILFVLLPGMEGVFGQQAEVFPLWPQGPKENNGLAGKTIIGEQGRVINNATAELLVFLPKEEKRTSMAVVICPGGGYGHLSIKHEGEEMARWLNELGITAVVLKYRMPNGRHRIPLADVQRAMRWIRARAEDWNIDPQKIGIAGFSAGGHLASTLATHFDSGNPKAQDRLARLSCRPDFVVLFYPVISMKSGLTHIGSRKALLGTQPTQEVIEKYSNELHVSAKTPPVFLVHCDDDATVSPLNSVVFYQALKKHRIPAVMYIFPTGGHGWGMRDSFAYYPEWTRLLEKWLDEML